MRLKCSQPLAAIVMALAIAVLPCASFAQTTGAAVPAEGQTVVLDSVGFWRMFHELKPPVMATSDGLVLLADGASAINTPTAAAPDDWTGADFDDSQWVRRPLLGAIRSPYLSRLCLRGKFQIDDLSAVSQLTVSVRYHGGIILYVNGKEIERRNLPAKPPADGEWLAEPYAREAFLDAKGDLLLTNTLKQWRGSSKEEIVQHPAMKGREVSDLVIPRNVLRKGVNVLAIELRRAAYGQVVDEKKPQIGRAHV